MSAVDSILKRWPIWAFAVSAAMLAAAHAFQTFGHLPPCHMCLKQREVYWAALPVSALGAAALVTRWREPGRRVIGALLALVFAYGAYLAAFHAGAEWHWWPAPETCASTGRVSMRAIQDLMRGGGAAPPACDKAAWVFLGLSMAGWNFLISLGLVGLSALSALRPGRRR